MLLQDSRMWHIWLPKKLNFLVINLNPRLFRDLKWAMESFIIFRIFNKIKTESLLSYCTWFLWLAAHNQKRLIFSTLNWKKNWFKSCLSNQNVSMLSSAYESIKFCWQEVWRRKSCFLSFFGVVLFWRFEVVIDLKFRY